MVLAKTLAQNQLRVVRMQMRVESSAHASLNAMVGPQHLLAISRLNGFEGKASGMIGGEGVMIARVPVLGQNHMAEGGGNPIDHRHHFLAARHSKSASIAEVILHVDHQQNIAVCKLDAHLRNYSARKTAGCAVA